MSTEPRGQTAPWTWSYQARQAMEFKDIELREGRLTGGFTTNRLEIELNKAGSKGWSCVGVVEVDKIRGAGKNREGILLIMQRPAPPT